MTRELADVAEAIVAQVARSQAEKRKERYGVPRRASDGQRSRWAIVGLGKLGGRELNYHSDLDLVFLFEEAGETGGGPDSVTNEHWLTEVARRVLKSLAGAGSSGPIYSVDSRLRPHGVSGPLVVTLETLRNYFQAAAQPWERLAWTRARVVFATGGFGKTVAEAIHEALSVPVDPVSLGREVLAMRRKLEDGCPRTDLKRGFGGLTDIEFLIQYLQLVHVRNHPEILRPNAWDALDALRRTGLLESDDHAELRKAYDFLRGVESRLRIVQNRSVAELPENIDELVRLARRLHYSETDPQALADAFRADTSRFAERTRALFQKIMAAPVRESVAP